MSVTRPVRICDVQFRDCYVICMNCGATITGCTPEEVAATATREGWKYVPFWDAVVCPRCDGVVKVLEDWIARGRVVWRENE